MIEQMMHYDGTLRMVTAAPGERRHLQVQLLDQPVTMRRDNVHVGRGTVRPVEKRLRRSSETVAILLVPREPERRSSAPRGDCQHLVHALEPRRRIGPEMHFRRLGGCRNR